MWPDTPKKKMSKRKKEKIPSVVTSEEWQKFHEMKATKKKEVEELKQKRKEEREAKKRLREEEAIQRKENKAKKVEESVKKNKRKKKRDTSDESDTSVDCPSNISKSEVEDFVSSADEDISALTKAVQVKSKTPLRPSQSRNLRSRKK